MLTDKLFIIELQRFCALKLQDYHEYGYNAGDETAGIRCGSTGKYGKNPGIQFLTNSSKLHMWPTVVVEANEHSVCLSIWPSSDDDVDPYQRDQSASRPGHAKRHRTSITRRTAHLTALRFRSGRVTGAAWWDNSEQSHWGRVWTVQFQPRVSSLMRHRRRWQNLH